ncbi:hypothetical protein [Kitasatospora sp. NPDC008115]|uniref:effector-associated constant component EACC1 n=1 Tax=Kitasatospora sp. NPDC008115 TaxID=3364022 RepID=UPI0036E71549
MAEVFIAVGNGAHGDGNGDGNGGTDRGPGRGADVHGLARWLAGEPALRGRVRHARSGPPVAGAMGTVSDLLIAVLEPGGAVTVLVGSVVAWVRGRRERRTVTLRRADGVEVTVASDRVGRLDPEELAALVRAVAEAIEPSGADAPEVPADPADPADADEPDRRRARPHHRPGDRPEGP